MRKFCAFLLGAVLLSACGYRMVGFDSSTTFYLKEINNKSNDLNITLDLERNVIDFFSGYGILVTQTAADYILTVNLLNVEVSAAGRSATREATTSSLALTFSFTAEDKTQKVIYNSSIARSQSFGTGDSAEAYREQFETAFFELTEDILSEFKYEIDSLRR
jgi:outer membrane lipopolysaccharide assembly protein LptE/RlpB